MKTEPPPVSNTEGGLLVRKSFFLNNISIFGVAQHLPVF